MSQSEFRVRPVIRHIVTRYTREAPLPEGVMPEARKQGLETLGEFGNEEYAEQIRAALQEQAAPKEYVMVKHLPGEAVASVHYAYSLDEATAFMLVRASQNEDWKVFSRPRQT